MRPEQFLSTNPVFSREQLLAALRERGDRSPATASSHLARWQKEGRARRIKEGLYAHSGPVDLYAVASRLAPDAVVGYHSALEIHGLAQSLFERLYFATWTKAKPVHFDGREFVPVRPRAGLRRAADKLGWTEWVDRGGLDVRVSTLERTVVDVLDRPELAGGFDEVWRSCSHVTALDLGETERYVACLGRKALAAKVGFFLERRAEHLVVPDALLARLQRHGPKSTVTLDRKEGGRLARRWNLVIPRAWTAEGEEPTP